MTFLFEGMYLVPESMWSISYTSNVSLNIENQIDFIIFNQPSEQQKPISYFLYYKFTYKKLSKVFIMYRY